MITELFVRILSDRPRSEAARLRRPVVADLGADAADSSASVEDRISAIAAQLDAERLPWRRNAVLLTSDATALCGSTVVALGTFAASHGESESTVIFLLIPVVLCIAAFGFSGLYATVPLSPISELRAACRATTCIFGLVALNRIVMVGGSPWMMAYMTEAWLLGLLSVPIARAGVRKAFGRSSWWGCAVIVLGTGARARRVITKLRCRPELGLRAVAVLGRPLPGSRDLDGIPILGDLSLAPRLTRHARLKIAIVSVGDFQEQNFAFLVDRYGSAFERLLVIPDLLGLDVSELEPRNVGGVVGLEMRQRLLVPWRQRLKRVIDLTITIAGGLAFLPAALLIAVLIKLDSPGPVFFRQCRLGQGGRCFHIIKFRTMHVGAHERLRSLLESDPVAREEYERFHKLRHDPRVTRVGRVLRRYSLDEIPQLLNVLSGEMSLTGPRAYMPTELPKMRGKERIILRVCPGISGYWQVLGRNDVAFETRLEMDLHYIHNWFLSSDLYLLARTIPVVLFGKGAA